MMLSVCLSALLLTSCYGTWLNFSYSPPDELFESLDLRGENYATTKFSYTICINNDTTYIRFYLWSDIVPGRAWPSVGLGTTSPHIGGGTGTPRRYGNEDPAKHGAYAIIWATPEVGGSTQYGSYPNNDPLSYNGLTPGLLEYDLNDGITPGTPLAECNNLICAELEYEIYNESVCDVVVRRNNIEGGPVTFQFDNTVDYILAQWAFTPPKYNNYWYWWEHSHWTRGSFVHNFATQTSVTGIKYVNKMAMNDIIDVYKAPSGIYMAMEMNSITGNVTMELWGPADRWFGIGWGGHSQGDGLVYTNDDPLQQTSNYATMISGASIYDYSIWGFEIEWGGYGDMEGIYPDKNQDWDILEETETAGEKYFKVRRKLNSDDTPTAYGNVKQDVDFNIADDSMIFFVAKANGSSLAFEYHDDNYYIVKVDFSINTGASSNIGTTKTWMQYQIDNNKNVNCRVSGTESPTVSPTQQTDTPSNAPTQVTQAPQVTPAPVSASGSEANSLLTWNSKIISLFLVLTFGLGLN